MTRVGEDKEMLPLQQQELLRSAIGRKLVEVERWLPTGLADHLARGGDAEAYFSRSSGATQLEFSGGVVHALSVWSSQLSIAVDGQPLPENPFAERIRLSETRAAPMWLRGCLGHTVRDVRVYVYRDDVPSDEARQAAISYVLDSGVELFFCTYLHGRMDSNELLSGEEVPREAVSRCVSLGRGQDVPAT